jgi:hypothetical protein
MIGRHRNRCILRNAGREASRRLKAGDAGPGPGKEGRKKESGADCEKLLSERRVKQGPTLQCPVSLGTVSFANLLGWQWDEIPSRECAIRVASHWFLASPLAFRKLAVLSPICWIDSILSVSSRVVFVSCSAPQAIPRAELNRGISTVAHPVHPKFTTISQDKSCTL